MKHVLVGALCLLSSVGIGMQWGLGVQLAALPLFFVFGTYVGSRT